MQSTRFIRPLLSLALAAAAGGAHAADVDLAGQIAYNTDVVEIAFSLAADGSNVKMWTDSWNSGANFDPTTALWLKSGSDYRLVQETDDDDTIAAGQGYFDSGMQFASLAHGSYLYTIAASPNYAAGSVLATGFAFDGTTPIQLADWEQPGNNPNTHDQKGGLWSVHFSGVDQAAAVPEPSAWLLMAIGLAGIGFLARRRAGR